MSKTEITNALKLFVSSTDSFRLVYKKSNNFELTDFKNYKQRLLILDSSFNPPHIGHLSLIKKGIVSSSKIFNNDLCNTLTINNNGVLLLFSLKNADKGDNFKTNEYIRRLMMIYKMCDYVNQELGIDCFVGVSKKSLFVEKDEDLKFIKNKCYLLGFDTLVRLFDLKYYDGKNENLVNILQPFFEECKIFTLLRKDEHFSIQSQLDFIENIKQQNEISSGDKKIKIPGTWKDKIIFDKSENEWNISSSEIRELIGSKDSRWKPLVIPEVADFLENHDNGPQILKK